MLRQLRIFVTTAMHDMAGNSEAAMWAALVLIPLSACLCSWCITLCYKGRVPQEAGAMV